MSKDTYEDYDEIEKPRSFHTAEGYTKSKRALILFVGLFWVSVIIGVEYNSDSTISIL
jgi:hypothetical protein